MYKAVQSNTATTRRRHHRFHGTTRTTVQTFAVGVRYTIARGVATDFKSFCALTTKSYAQTMAPLATNYCNPIRNFRSPRYGVQLATDAILTS